MTGDLILLSCLLAAIALGDCGVMLLVRADERQRERDAEAKRAARADHYRPPASAGANSPTQATHCRPALAGFFPGRHIDFPADARPHQRSRHDDVSPPPVTVQSSDRWAR